MQNIGYPHQIDRIRCASAANRMVRWHSARFRHCDGVDFVHHGIAAKTKFHL